MSCLVFDASGSVCELATLKWSRLGGPRLHGQRLLDHLIGALGYVAVKQDKDALYIYLRPAKTSQLAFGALCYHLADGPPVRIVVHWLDGVWKFGIFGTIKTAIHHLTTIIPKIGDRADDFHSQPRALASAGLSAALGALLECWQGARGRASYCDLKEVLDRTGLEQYLFVRTGADRAHYYEEVGRNFPWLDGQWLRRARGLRLQDQPDYYFGEWVASAYRQLVGEASVHDVDAVVRAPSRPPVRARFTRLLLPVEMPAGGSGMLGALMLNPAIDLRAGRLV